MRWKEIHGTICGTSDAGFLGCAAAIQNFDWLDRLPGAALGMGWVTPVVATLIAAACADWVSARQQKPAKA